MVSNFEKDYTASFNSVNPLLIWDGSCGFCRIWIDYWKHRTTGRLASAPFQEVANQYPQIPIEDFKHSVQLVQPDGQVVDGARAVFGALAYAPELSWLLWSYRRLPGFAPLSEAVYHFVAYRRSLFYRLTVFFFGPTVETAQHDVVSGIFLRLLGLIYFVAFSSFAVQIDGLIGSHGILPVGDYLDAAQTRFGPIRFWVAPTLFWLSAHDFTLKLVAWTGALVSVALTVGLAQRTAPTILLIFYVSLVTAGQTFMAFQWDNLLLEAGFLAIFLPFSSGTIWLLRWLLFRLMFMSGVLKLLGGDAAWSSLTALNYYYETQPLPTIVGWYVHHLPAWFQRLSVACVLGIEIGASFLIFAPRRLRFFAAASLALLQVLILLTGNYTFFPWLTLALCWLLFDDAAVRAWIPHSLGNASRRRSAAHHGRQVSRGILGGLAVAILLLSSLQLVASFTGHLSGPAGSILAWISPLRIINPYGLFSMITTTRLEIILEGSHDGGTWLEYKFKYKPDDLTEAPHWVAPHQPRLDWQMWFAALRGNSRHDRWFSSLVAHLLRGGPEVLSLLEHNPFPDEPPRFVRSLLYQYHFTDLPTWQAQGRWWHRELLTVFSPSVSLTE